MKQLTTVHVPHTVLFPDSLVPYPVSLYTRKPTTAEFSKCVDDATSSESHHCSLVFQRAKRYSNSRRSGGTVPWLTVNEVPFILGIAHKLRDVGNGSID